MLFQESKNRADAARSTVEALNFSVSGFFYPPVIIICNAMSCRPSVVLFHTELISDCQAEALKDALRRSPDYKAYLTRLVTAGYFRDEVEGSQLWNELENKAANVYVEVRREEYVPLSSRKR
jgi:hypothetical protein